jgi:hypothetical protein
MTALKGIYDGQNFVALEPFSAEKRYKVIITLVEEIAETGGERTSNRDIDTSSAESLQMRTFAAQTDAFAFWSDEREDLYQDFLKFPTNASDDALHQTLM